MTTLVNSRPAYKSVNTKYLWILFLLFALSIGAVVVSKHAISKHKMDAVRVHICIANGGEIQRRENKTTNRIARVCQIETELFGIQILEKIDGEWREITAFIKNKMRTLARVEQYMGNTGYDMILPID